MKDFIEVYENTLTREVCDKVMTYTDLRLSTMSEDKKRGLIGGDEIDVELKDSYDLHMKLDDDNEISISIRNALLPRIDKYIQSNPQLNLLPRWKYQNVYNLQKYNPGMGFHSLHCENTGAKPKHSVNRLAAWMIYLTTIKKRF